MAPRVFGKRRSLHSRRLFVILVTAASGWILFGVQPLIADVGPTTAPFAWKIETADPGAGTGLHTSIAVDGIGAPMISYVNTASGTVQLARRVRDNWNSEIVAGPGFFSGDTNVAIASNGTIETSYFDERAGAVVFAAKGPGGWDASSIDSGFSEGYNRLALDSSGRPAIAYTGFDGSLRYATWNGTQWSIDIVDHATIISRYPDLAFDPLDRPNIAYYGNGTLLFAKKTSLGWTRAVVDPTANAGWFSRIRVDSRGVAHIAYYASSNKSLMYATADGSGWNRSVIDSEGDAGFDLSFAIDRDDRGQIAYYARRSGVLRYAIETSQGWVRETVDDTGVAGWYTGIVADVVGFPHISYYDWSDGDLRYAEGKIGLQVRSLAASSTNATSAVLGGELVALGNHSLASVGFALHAVGTVDWAYRAAGNLTHAGSFHLLVTNLTANNTYEFYAVALAGNESSQGAIRSFRLSSSAPPSPSYGLLASIGVGGVGALAVGYLVFRRRGQRLRKAPEREVR